MNANLLHHLSLVMDSHGVYAEDFPDQLMSKYTSQGLIFLSIFMALKQYIFKPIQCWTPAEWPRPWEEYTENYCWIQNTYHVAFMEPGHPGLHAREESEIGYFQWVPILLAIQALLVLAPHIFWRVASAHSGCDPHRIVKLAMELEQVQHERKRHKLVRYLSSLLRNSITMATKLHKSGQLSCSRLSQQCDGYLFTCYVASKVVYLLCGLGHLYLMKVYLGFQELHFGWTCALDLLQGRQWQQTRVFPRVTFCDVPIKHVGQWNTRSVQCVLPSNMLNEKIYIFLWFWIVFCMALTFAYSVYWIVSLAAPSQRWRFVGSLLRIAHQPAAGRSAAMHSGLQPLRLDGAFILLMVATRCGDLCAADILGAVVEAAAAQAEPGELKETLPRRGVAPSFSADHILDPKNVAMEPNGHLGPISSV